MKAIQISIFTLFLNLGLIISAIAQNEVDALRYSQIIPGGAARFTSMGSAFGSIGGNISVASTNPAGLGIFNTSSMTFTPAFGFNSISNTFDNTSFSDFKAGLQINDFGFVFAAPTGNEHGWKSTAMVFNYTRHNSYTRNFYAEGINNNNSITDYFAVLGKGYHINELDDYNSGLAYSAYLIDPDSNSQSSYHSVYDRYGELQQFIISSRGNLGEYQCAFAGNYDDRFYLGGSFNIQSVRYKEQTTVSEKDVNDVIYNFNSMKYNTYLVTTGVGLNVKIGAIYRPLDWFKIGMALHTPTIFDFTDTYSSKIESNFDTASYSQSLESQEYESYYRIITPMRFITSFGFLIKRSLLLNIEGEMVDYSTIRMSSSDYTYTEENNSIRQHYTLTYNVRGGLEYRIQNFTIRLGGGYYGSPYSSGQVNENSYTLVYSGGFGFRVDNIFFNLGYYRTINKSTYYFYDPALIPNAPSTQLTSITSQFSGGIRVMF